MSGIKVESITLATSGEVTVKYNTGQPDLADCDFSSLDKGILNYSWRDATALGYEVANGSAQVEFQDDYCLLRLNSDFTKDSKSYDLAVMLVMAEKK